MRKFLCSGKTCLAANHLCFSKTQVHRTLDNKTSNHASECSAHKNQMHTLLPQCRVYIYQLRTAYGHPQLVLMLSFPSLCLYGRCFTRHCNNCLSDRFTETDRNGVPNLPVFCHCCTRKNPIIRELLHPCAFSDG